MIYYFTYGRILFPNLSVYPRSGLTGGDWYWLPYCSTQPSIGTLVAYFLFFTEISGFSAGRLLNSLALTNCL